MLDKIRGAVIGFAAADALGVPVEFMERQDIARDPVTDMRGWGTYMQPPGTWSDDTGMVLATMDSLVSGYDPENMMQRFVMWSHGDTYWPYDQVFDMGMTINKAIGRYKTGVPSLACGLSGEKDNGNGSLMRILPAALYLYPETGPNICRNEKAMSRVHEISKLTHAHPRSMIACGMYVSVACQLLAGQEIRAAVHTGVLEAAGFYIEKDYVTQLNHFTRLADIDSFRRLPAKEISSTGYVVDTLEAALWCLLNTDSYKECVLKAVNLGQDTDTVAAVAGGLAGIFYGIGAVPPAWQLMMPKTGFMDILCRQLYSERYEKQ